MAAFPTTPAPTWAYIVESEFNTIVSDFDNGSEQRRQKWLYPKFNIKLSYYGLSSTASDSIWAFYHARNGAYEAFHWFDPLDPSSYTGLYIGTGNSSDVNFDLPAKQSQSHAVLLDGVATTEFSVTTAAGTDGSDQITFVAAPTDGTIITCNLVGQLRVRCRFAEDKLSRNNFDKQLFSYGIELKGLAPL